MKSVWVKSLIEKGAKSATEEFYRFWVKEAHKALSKRNKPQQKEKKLQLDNDPAKISSAIQKIPSSNNMILENESGIKIDPVNELSDDSADTITVPLIGIQTTLRTIFIIITLLLFSFGCSYFFFRIYSVRNEIENWKTAHQVLEDRLLFLQTFAAHLALNTTEHSGKNSELQKLARKLDWKLSESREDVGKLHQSLLKTLTEVSSLLDYSSSKELGFPNEALQQFVKDEILLNRKGYAIVLNTDSESSWFSLIFTFIFSILLAGTICWASLTNRLPAITEHLKR